MNNKKNIEELFKERLLEHEITPPEWNTLEAKYSKHLRKKKITRYSVFSVIVAAIIIAGILLTTHNTHTSKITAQNENKATTNIASKTVNSTQQHIPEEASKPSQQSTPKENKQPQKNKNKQADNPQNNTKAITTIPKEVNNNEEIKHHENLNQQTSQEVQPEKASEDIISQQNSFEYKIEKYTGCVPFKTPIYIKGQNIKNAIAKIGKNNFPLSNGDFIYIEEPGTYFVTIKVEFLDNTTKEYKVTKPLIAHPKPRVTAEFVDNSIIKINSIATSKIIATLDNTATFTGKSTIDAKDILPGTHNMIIIATNEGCSDTINFSFIKQEDIILNMPNAFTPNGDGMNDVFKPVFNKMPESYKLIVYDKFGKTVFVSTNPETGWDGQNSQPGLYVWKVIYKNVDGKAIEKTGNVTLIK